MNTLKLDDKRGPIQCWQCGKFRKNKDIYIRRDRESGDWNDVVCKVCREKERVA